jgi:catechol 2,3-dioxygenase-like lactoylglutathione lyase family enzyme
MAATGLNHVSVSARDAEESARFYIELLGMTRIPSPNFGHTVIWLRTGDLQLHLFEEDVEAPQRHHFALSVDDLGEVYRKARELSILVPRANGGTLRELPDGSVQFYLRDPAGNLVEIDHPDAAGLDADLRADLRPLAGDHPQSEENRRAILFLARDPATR